MARSTSSYFSNALPALPAMGFDVNIYEEHSTPRWALGTKFERHDGNIYRYVHFGATVNRGVLVARDLSETDVVDTDNAIIAPASAQTTTDGTIGSKFIELTLASVIADQYAGGIIYITDDTGEGYSYRIKGNTATDNPATGNIRVELYDKLIVAVDTSSDFAISGSKYSNLEIATAGTDMLITGVSVRTIGMCPVLQDASIIAQGQPVYLSALTSGAVGIWGGTGATVGNLQTSWPIGKMVQVGDSTGHSVIDLMLA
jgi:hypothetical protein